MSLSVKTKPFAHSVMSTHSVEFDCIRRCITVETRAAAVISARYSEFLASVPAPDEQRSFTHSRYVVSKRAHASYMQEHQICAHTDSTS